MAFYKAEPYLYNIHLELSSELHSKLWMGYILT